MCYISDCHAGGSHLSKNKITLSENKKVYPQFRRTYTSEVLFVSFLFYLNTGPLLKRKLQVSSSTFTLKNPVRDKRTQQSYPAEDSSSRAGPTDAAHDPRTQPAACGEVLFLSCLSHLL